MNTKRRFPDTPRPNRAVLAITALLALGIPGALPGQAPDHSTSWRTILLPQVDLWYHGLATAEYQGPGADDFYDPAYALRLRDEKQRAGVLPTRLDDQAMNFASSFRRDSAFEVFHFVPLYFAASTVDPMLAALAIVADSEGIPDVGDPLAQFGASAIAQTLPRGDQRAILGDWVAALQAEWDEFFGTFWRDQAIANGPVLQAIQAEWDAVFAPALGPYLQAYSLDNGVLVLSAPLGPEGRIFEGDPANRSDNIVVVGFDPAASPRATLFAAVRELCFPVARNALAGVPEPSDRAEASTRSSHAALRCGALLLDRSAPDLGAEYRSWFTPEADGSPADVQAAFERAYVIDAAVDAAIQRELGAIPGP